MPRFFYNVKSHNVKYYAVFSPEKEQNQIGHESNLFVYQLKPALEAAKM